MAAVENPDLHEFIRGDVAGERDPDLVERRPAGGELVLDHPLLELLAEDRPVVLDAPLFVEDRALPVSRRRRNAVDHPVWKSDIAADKGGKRGIGHLGEADDGVLGDVAVARKIVAGHDRIGRDAGGAPLLQAGGDEAEGRLRRVGRLAVGDDVGMGGIEMLRRGGDVIAAFGDGERDDADRRINQRGEVGGDVERLDEIDHRAGDMRRTGVGLLFDDGGEPVLRLELLAHSDVGLADAGADDRPVAVGA